MITYAEQLQSPEWKRKRFHILQRDNFHCQHCGTFGISGYNIFIPLSTLYDIDSYINDEKLQNLIFHSFLDLIFAPADPSERYQKSQEEKATFQFHKTISIEGTDDSVYNVFLVKSKDWLEKHPKWTNALIYLLGGTTSNQDNDYLLLPENMPIGSTIVGQKKIINPETSICSFDIKSKNEDSYGLLNVTGDALHVLFNNVEIDDGFVRDCVYFYTNLRKDNEHKMELLDIHHKSYICGHYAWEYDDNNLVTLCRTCHEKEHAKHNVLLYDEDDCLLRELHTCDRCLGSGYLHQYDYYRQGVCFNCGGQGVV